jgi:secondary thiamine-phosphate synthase enzyme
MIDALDKLAPEKAKYRHNAEGPDDMVHEFHLKLTQPAHIKAVLTGTSVSIPISGGKLALGTWQGIYLCEFRNSAHRRTLVATIQGE